MLAVRQARDGGAPMRNRPRSWQSLSVSAAALLLVVTGMMAVAAHASASTVQVVSGTRAFYDVACPSATICEAVGFNTSGQGVVVPITNGTPGTAQVVGGTGISLAWPVPAPPHARPWATTVRNRAAQW